jgi:cyanophycinase
MGLSLILTALCGLLGLLGLVSSVSVSLGSSYSMVLVGGGLADKNDDIWGTVIRLAGGAGVARIGVIAAAGENPCCDEDSSFYYYKNELLMYGAAEVVYLNLTTATKEQNENPEVIALIKQMTGFFFTGGDQLRVMYSLYNNDERIPSSALLAIKEQLLSTGGKKINFAFTCSVERGLFHD